MMSDNKDSVYNGSVTGGKRCYRAAESMNLLRKRTEKFPTEENEDMLQRLIATITTNPSPIKYALGLRYIEEMCYLPDELQFQQKYAIVQRFWPQRMWNVVLKKVLLHAKKEHSRNHRNSIMLNDEKKLDQLQEFGEVRLWKLLCTKGISFFLDEMFEERKKHTNHKSFANNVREGIQLVMTQVGEPEGYAELIPFIEDALDIKYHKGDFRSKMFQLFTRIIFITPLDDPVEDYEREEEPAQYTVRIRRRRLYDECLFCGLKGHHMETCKFLGYLLDNGTLKINVKNRICLKDGKELRLFRGGIIKDQSIFESLKDGLMCSYNPEESKKKALQEAELNKRLQVTQLRILHDKMDEKTKISRNFFTTVLARVQFSARAYNAYVSGVSTINAISKKVADEMNVKYDMDLKSSFNLFLNQKKGSKQKGLFFVNGNNEPIECVGFVKSLAITVLNFAQDLPFFVLDTNKFDIILGRSWCEWVQLQYLNYDDKYDHDLMPINVSMKWNQSFSGRPALHRSWIGYKDGGDIVKYKRNTKKGSYTIAEKDGTESVDDLVAACLAINRQKEIDHKSRLITLTDPSK